MPESPAAAPTEKVALLGRGASLSFVMQAAGVAARYVSQAALARWLGAATFGSYTWAVNLSQFLATPCNLGGENSGLRFVPEYRAKGEWALLRGVLRVFRAVPLALGAAVATAAALVMLVAGSGPAGLTLALIALVSVPFFALVDVQTVLARAFGSLFWAVFPALVLLPLAITLVVGAVVLSGAGPTAEQAGVVTVVVLVLIAGLQAIILRRISQKEVGEGEKRYEPGTWLGVSMPLLAVSSMNLVFQRADVLAVGIILDARRAGIYAIAFRTAALSSLLQAAMNTTVAPRISQLFWSGRKELLEATVLRAIRVIFFPSLVITAVLIAFGGPILGLFGNGFREGWAALAVYALGQLVSVGNGPVGWLLNLSGHHSLSAKVNAVSAAVCLAGYVAFIPLFGIVGAALANAFGVALKNVWSNVVVRRQLGLHLSVVRALTTAGSGTAT